MSSGVKAFLGSALVTIALNIASNMLGESPLVLPVLLIIAFAALGVTFIPIKTQVDEQGVEIESPRATFTHEAQHFLVFFLLGALFGSIAVLPVFPLTLLDSGLARFGIETSTFYTYELVAIGAVTLIAVAGLVLRQSIWRVLTVIVAGAGGSTIAMALLRSGELDPVATFAGWSAAGIGIILLVALLPKAGRIIVDYFTPRPRQPPGGEPLSKPSEDSTTSKKPAE